MCFSSLICIVLEIGIYMIVYWVIMDLLHLLLKFNEPYYVQI
ncbi:hypothetical protein RchiOBHm_Chr2g0164881 [Rosa chinensis]|uniref:Uncharacterized protein n=1 Tax=Rosa chinensis TaxID=74649 RepID=A0A2P6S3N8_ROSCH|nr:hypothetical protein RchiOBHm_Chr2g0164881 [Rosa chinensis]